MAYYSDGNNFDELINKSEKTNLLDKKQNKTPKQMFDDLLKLLNIQ